MSDEQTTPTPEEQKALAVIPTDAPAPAFMNEGEGAGRDSVDDDEGQTRLHLCQPNSPEVAIEESHRMGEFAVRPSGETLGTKFKCCVVGARREAVQWPTDDSDQSGRPIARYRWADVQPGGAHAELFQYTQWNDNEKDPKKRKPVFTDSRLFAIVVFDESGEAFILDDSGEPKVFLMTCDRSSAHTGKQIRLALGKFLEKNPKAGINGPVFEVESNKAFNEDAKATYFTIEARQIGLVATAALYEQTTKVALAFDALEKLMAQADAGTGKKLIEAKAEVDEG